MATISAVTDTIDSADGRAFVTTWAGFSTNGDVGAAVHHVSCRDRCVQFTGTWGTGGTAILQGSNDADEDTATWFTLKDKLGNAVSATADALFQVLHMPRHLRPKLSAGTGSIDVDVTLIERVGLR
jgi:hypothetical protein